MNRLDANRRTAGRYPGGIDALAVRMNKSPVTLRKELSGAPGFKFGIECEDELMSLCQAAGVVDPLAPLMASAVSHGARVIALPINHGRESSSFQCLAETAREFSEFVASVADAEADGTVTANEVKRVDRELGELIAMAETCAQRLRAMHEAAKPAHLREVRAAQ